MYTTSHPETMVIESIANSLDEKASTIKLSIENKKAPKITSFKQSDLQQFT